MLFADVSTVLKLSWRLVASEAVWKSGKEQEMLQIPLSPPSRLQMDGKA